MTAEHDEIWAYTDDLSVDIEKMSQEDIEELAALGWTIDDENEGFHHFV